MGRARYLTEDQQAVAKKAYRLALTETVRYVRKYHPSEWEHALREAFLLLGVQPPNAVVREHRQKLKKRSNDLPVAFLRQEEINRVANMPLKANSSPRTPQMVVRRQP